MIDRENFLGWHSVTIEILNQAKKNSDFPEEALFWIYENSQCACCRYDAVKIMQNRHILTKSMIEECRFDAFEETRKTAEKILKNF